MTERTMIATTESLGESCITCGDVAVVLEVVSITGPDAVCRAPDGATELVAIGAAAQAAATLTGEAPDAVARRWGTRQGVVLEPVERDDATLDRHHQARTALAGGAGMLPP